MSKFGKHLETILKEMSSRVSCDYDSHDWLKHDHYTEYNWTEEEESDFIKWMTNYLYENTSARNELMTIKTKNKKNCREASKQFVYNYGWTYARVH